MADRGDGSERPVSDRYHSRGPDSLRDFSCEGDAGSRIRNIILISTDYDLFLLEEEGRLTDHFRDIYIETGSTFIPNIDHASNGQEAIDKVSSRSYDLVISFNQPSDLEIFDLTVEIKKKSPGTKVALLASNTPEVRRIVDDDRSGKLDLIMTWNGDGTIIETMVRIMEDLKSRKCDPTIPDPLEIIIGGSDIGKVSAIMEIAHRTVHSAFLEITGSDPTPRRRRRLNRRLPRIIPVLLHGEETFKPDRGRRIGAAIFQGSGPELKDVLLSVEGNDYPVLLVADDDGEIGSSSVSMISSTRHNVDLEVRKFLENVILPEDLAAESKTAIPVPIRELRSLVRGLQSIEETDVSEIFSMEKLKNWFDSILEFEIARWIKTRSGSTIDKMELIEMVKQSRLLDRRGSVMDYNRDQGPGEPGVMRIGKGPMGGKARGLAFMDRVLCHSLDSLPENCRVSIPPMVIICTDIFSAFMDQNGLLNDELITLSDERIADRFLNADLPTTLLGDLRSIVKSFKGPLSIRSSSLLEDAVFQPFAGVYASLMVPNNDPSADKRFKDLARAVKYVYASTYFKEARDYIRATSNRLEEERMGVIIQSVSGMKHGELFYPSISGVARSEDYWPLPGCGRKEGTVTIALGLGKVIVDGMGGWKFCPHRPGVSIFNDVKELMDSSQRKFFAIYLGSSVPGAHPEETSTLKMEPIETALAQGTADLAVSTYDTQSDRFYPGPHREGPKVVDFAPILKEKAIKLPEVVRELLASGEKALGGPVEIEFTAEPDTDRKALSVHLLQIRSMVARWDSEEVDISPQEDETVLLRSKKVLGNGTDRSCRDLIYIKDPDFDLANSREAAEEISRLNRKISDLGRPYILIGPGRFGSSDPWLGIPVNWSDVSGAFAIVETPVRGRIIDPSQGSHFFQNMSSLKRSYFTLTFSENENMDLTLLESRTESEEGKHLIHAVLKEPACIRIDGRRGEGTISIPSSQKSNEKG